MRWKWKFETRDVDGTVGNVGSLFPPKVACGVRWTCRVKVTTELFLLKVPNEGPYSKAL